MSQSTPKWPGSPCSGHQGIAQDLTAAGAGTATISQVVAAAGKVDILVNSAGIALLDKALELSEQHWDATLAVNLPAASRWRKPPARS